MTEQNQTTDNFNADAFMQATVDQPMETEYQLCPEGTYQAMIVDFDSSAIERISFIYKKAPRTGQPGSMVKFNCPFSIQDPAVLAKMGRDNVQVEWQMIVDVDEYGQIDWGKDKNVRLGQLREAVGQNKPGTWAISNLRGAGPLMVKVVHESFKRNDGSEGVAARVIRAVALR